MMFTATCISRGVVRENVHVTVLKGSTGYDRIIPMFLTTVAVKPTFVAFL